MGTLNFTFGLSIDLDTYGRGGISDGGSGSVTLDFDNGNSSTTYPGGTPDYDGGDSTTSYLGALDFEGNVS